jgi:flagellar hook-basal body complex protein FliE
MIVAPLASIGAMTQGAHAAPLPATTPGEGDFAQVLGRLIDNVRGPQADAERAVSDLVSGRSENLHDVMLAVAKADLSFRMLLEVRNRLTEAYQDIMRMQI